MVGIKRNGGGAAEQTDVFSAGREHMKITPQGYIVLRGGNMCFGGDFMPITGSDAIFALKINLCGSCACGLHTVGAVEPQQNPGKQK